MEYNPGSLVRFRDRDWVVKPSDHEDLLLLQPLGGSADESTGVYTRLPGHREAITSALFPAPQAEDLGAVSSVRMLYNAARLSFRDGAGPFRSLARLSFTPRAYQMVPLIMALKQPLVRLLIADDVGIGKTLEALLIARELIARGEVKRFAVICLPHLCEQWQAELKDKFGIEAVIIRSNTQIALDKGIPGSQSIYEYYPYQIISIDYIKADNRRRVFVHQAPELVIVDEAHTCARPQNASKNQQQRHALISDIAQRPQQHLILLTATPHSGKPAEFRSLLGLLQPRFEQLDIGQASQAEKEELARYFIQRQRQDVTQWLDEDTSFPKREEQQAGYELTPGYLSFFEKVRDFSRAIVLNTNSSEGKKYQKNQQRLREWTVLTLLRSIMSSPAAGAEVLRNRLQKKVAQHATSKEGLSTDLDDLLEAEKAALNDTSELLQDFGENNDGIPDYIRQKRLLEQSEIEQLSQFVQEMEHLADFGRDAKINTATEVIKAWVGDGFHPVIFCQYIATAQYVGKALNQTQGFTQVHIEVITSELPDKERKRRIAQMLHAPQRILVATDCLSEGINLQQGFNAVLHYDLFWNPNRMAQREGRVDRFGQSVPKVKVCQLIGKNNPIDGRVLEVILQKIERIRQNIHVSIPFPEDSGSVLDAILHGVLFKSKEGVKTAHSSSATLELNFEGDLTHKLAEAKHQAEQSRSIFVQHAIQPEMIQQDLREASQTIGAPADVEAFVRDTLRHLGAQMVLDHDPKVYHLYNTINLPTVLQTALSSAWQNQSSIRVSFYSPTPQGCLYLGRNHPLVEQLANYVLNDAVYRETKDALKRAAVLCCKEVQVKTFIYLFRVRNLIENPHTHQQIIAEEMLLWGFRGEAQAETLEVLSHQEAQQLLEQATPLYDLDKSLKEAMLEQAKAAEASLQEVCQKVAHTRAEVLIEAHQRFRQVMDQQGQSAYRAVEPVLPMDLLGVYVLLGEEDFG